MSKSVLAVLVFAIALFVPGRIVRLIAHGQSYGGVAWAQDATDTDAPDPTDTDDSADVSTEPATAPPDIAGDWSGDVDDDNPDIGERAFSIEIGLHPNFPPVISSVRRLFRPSWGASF